MRLVGCHLLSSFSHVNVNMIQWFCDFTAFSRFLMHTLYIHVAFPYGSLATYGSLAALSLAAQSYSLFSLYYSWEFLTSFFTNLNHQLIGIKIQLFLMYIKVGIYFSMSYKISSNDSLFSLVWIWTAIQGLAQRCTYFVLIVCSR